jgi:hypothetical protein
MKSDELLEIIGEAQDEYILDARKTHKKQNPVWVKWAALAACLCLIFGMVWYFLAITPAYPNLVYTAQHIADVFPVTLDAGSTNAYEKIYVPSSEYLQLNTIPDAQKLPIYRFDIGIDESLSQEELRTFISNNLSRYCNALGISVPDYEIPGEKSYWDITTPDNRYRFSVSNMQNWTSFSLRSTMETEDPTIFLNGYAVQVDQRQTDQEILASLENVKVQLFDIYDVSFSHARVVRDYSGGDNPYGVNLIMVYFYDADANPLNSARGYPVSDYICIYFDNVRNFEGDFVSDTILSCADINYTNCGETLHAQIGTASMISLSEAEELLYKGYVFGGHSCPICMANQEKISFEGYDYVGFEYLVTPSNVGRIREWIPFYTFYKSIGTSKKGYTIYARTYVPAIEVSGLEDYFREQQQSHVD